VKRRDEVDVFLGLTQHLSGDPGARRVRNRVVTVQQLEAVGAHDFVHPYSEGEVIGRELEQRVAPDVYFVEENAGQKGRQPERLPVRYEMDFVPTIRERYSELRCYGA
jgi:hypothetical protein